MNDMTNIASAAPSKTAPDTDAEYQLSGFFPYQLSIASNAVSSLIAERYRRRFGLKVMEWRIMAVLGDTGAGSGPDPSSNAGPTGRPLTQRDLSNVTFMDKVAVNRACKVLEQRGLIARAKNANDGRSHLLELTGEGQAIHREILPLAKATERELFDGFGHEEEAALRAMLGRLRTRAAALSEQAS